MAKIESRRQAILEGMVRVVGRKGYRETTVAHVIAVAGVARTTFYKHFDDKHACFLAAYELAAGRVIASVEGACEAGLPWVESARRALGSLVELLADDPALARTVVVEATIVGTEGRRLQLALLDRLAQLLEEAGGPDTDGEETPRDLPPTTALMATSAVAGLLFDEIQAGRAAELRRRMPDLLFALLVPYLGPGQAAEEARVAESYAASR